MNNLAIDPYRVVNLALAELTGDGYTGPYTGRQLGEAATLAAALLAALGAVPVTPRRAGAQGLRGSLDRRSIGGRAHP